MQQFKTLILTVILLAVLGASGLTAQAADPGVDFTAKIDGDRFWSSFYTTAFGEEETITLYRIKSVTVDIKSGATILDSFTFTKNSDQNHHFVLSVPSKGVVIQYRAITYAERQFSFTFDYKPGVTLSIGNENTLVSVKAPYFSYH